MDMVNILSGVLHHNIAAIRHDVEITHADNLFTVSTFFVLVQTLQMSAVILMMHTEMMYLQHWTERNKLDLNQRDWTLKCIEFGRHVFSFSFFLFF